MRLPEPTTACATLEPEPSSPDPQERQRGARPAVLVTTWAVLGLLALGEILFLTIRHDARELWRGSQPLGRLAASASDVLQVLIVAAVAALALAAWRLRDCFGRAVEERGLTTGLWPWLPVHLAAFVALDLSSRHVFGDGATLSGRTLLIWVACFTGTALSGLAAAVPPRFWPGLIRRGGSLILAGFAVGLCGWVVSQLARLSWESSAATTFWAVGQLLGLFYAEVVSEPDSFVLGTPAFRVWIAPECSGYEGVGLVCLYLGLYLVLFRRELRFPAAFWLLPIGAAAAWCLNVVRIVALIAIGDSVSPELAHGGFHSQAGWLAFNAVALGLAFIAHRSRVFFAVAALDRTPNQTAAYLLPLLLVIAVQMLAGAFFTHPARLYPVHVIVGAACLAYYRRSIDGLGKPEAVLPDGGRSSRGMWFALFGGLTVFALWVGLWFLIPSDRSRPDPRADLAGLPDWAIAMWLIFRVAGAVVVLPLVEETAFRGYLLRRLAAADFESVSPRRLGWPALLISSAVFGLLHDQWLAGMLAGVIYAVVYSYRGRLMDAVLAHATTNGLLTITALSTGQWQLWS